LDTYKTFFQLEFTQTAIKQYQVLLIVYNPAEELVMMGVPREDIVLGLQAPYKRQYTDYGVA